MFKPGLNEFLGHKVVCVDWRLIQDEETRDAFRQASHITSICAIKATAEGIAITEPFWERSGTEHLQSLIGKFGVGDIMINVDMQVVEKLTKDELTAVMLHEHAHIVHGDLDREITNSYGNLNFVCVQDLELRADQYAAMHQGKAVLQSALKKLIHFSGSLADYGDGYYDLFLKCNPEIAERINALS